MEFDPHILDSREIVLQRPTHEMSVEYGDQNVGTGIVDARKVVDGKPVGKTILWPMAYEARLDPFEKQRFVTMAEALNARVIAVEMPGVGINEGAKMTLRQRLDLLGGDFTSTAVPMLRSVIKAAALKSGEELDFVCYSEGASTGSAMLELLGQEFDGVKLKVPRMTIIEAVNDQDWDLFELLGKIAEEDTSPAAKALGVEHDVTDRYLAQNKPFDWLVEPYDRTKRGKDHLGRLKGVDLSRWPVAGPQLLSAEMGGAAMRKGFAPQLVKAVNNDRLDNTTGISQAKIEIIKFNGSGVSRLEENRLTADQLKVALKGGEIALKLLINKYNDTPHHHPAVHSMPNAHVISDEFLR